MFRGYSIVLYILNNDLFFTTFVKYFKDIRKYMSVRICIQLMHIGKLLISYYVRVRNPITPCSFYTKSTRQDESPLGRTNESSQTFGSVFYRLMFTSVLQ